MGQAGIVYLAGAFVLGLMYIHSGARLAAGKTNVLGRRLVLASIIYLPLVLALMMLDKATA